MNYKHFIWVVMTKRMKPGLSKIRDRSVDDLSGTLQHRLHDYEYDAFGPAQRLFDC